MKIFIFLSIFLPLCLSSLKAVSNQLLYLIEIDKFISFERLNLQFTHNCLSYHAINVEQFCMWALHQLTFTLLIWIFCFTKSNFSTIFFLFRLSVATAQKHDTDINLSLRLTFRPHLQVMCLCVSAYSHFFFSHFAH